MKNNRNTPLSVILLHVGDAVIGWGLMAFSMFLTCKLTFHFLTTGIENPFYFAIVGVIGIALGIAIDSAKCVSIIKMTIEDGWQRWVFFSVWIVALFISLVASYSELGRESYVSTVKSEDYLSVKKQIESSQADLETYRYEIGNTRFHKRKDMYQSKVDSISRVIAGYKAEHEKMRESGAGQGTFFNKSIRAFLNWVGIPSSARGADTIFGIILEVIGTAMLILWGINNADRIKNWSAMRQDLVSARDSRIFIENRLAEKKALISVMRSAINSPENAVDVDDLANSLDMRVAVRLADMQKRGYNLPAHAKKMLDSIPLKQLPDPEADRLIGEIDALGSETVSKPKAKLGFETIPESFETTPESFETKSGKKSETETETEPIGFNPKSEPKPKFETRQDQENFLEKLRKKALAAKKLKASERYALAVEMKQQNMSNAEIGRALGMTGQGVGKLLKNVEQFQGDSGGKIPIGATVGHPSDPIAYRLIGYQGDFAIVEANGIKKQFPATEIWDVNEKNNQLRSWNKGGQNE